MDAVLICSGCHNEILQTGWFEQQNLIFLRFWRLEVQDQDVSIFSFWWRLFYWLACLHSLLTASSRGLSLIGAGRERCRGQQQALWCLLEGHQSCWIRDPSSWPHPTLITSSDAPSPGTATLGIRASTCYFWGGHKHSVCNGCFSCIL